MTIDRCAERGSRRRDDSSSAGQLGETWSPAFSRSGSTSPRAATAPRHGEVGPCRPTVALPLQVRSTIALMATPCSTLLCCLLYEQFLCAFTSYFFTHWMLRK